MKNPPIMGFKVFVIWLILSLSSFSLGNPTEQSHGDEHPSSEITSEENLQESPSTEMDHRGFYGDTFDEGLKRFSPYKRSGMNDNPSPSPRNKRNAYDPGYMSYMNTIGYDPTMAWGRRKRNMYMDYGGYDPYMYATKRSDFGHYYYPQHFLGPAYKRDTDTSYNDVYLPYQQFYGGFKKKYDPSYYAYYGSIYKRSISDDDVEDEPENYRNKRDVVSTPSAEKRKPEMDASGFHGDMFSNGFGDFYTYKKRKLGMGNRGFHGDTFTEGFGDFSTMRKRKPEMDSSGFYGDTFSGGFGDFYTMKRNMKRRPEMDSTGFYGDTFNGGFGDFYTMKRNPLKRRPEMTSSGFHGDTFSGGFGDFYTMKKKSDPEAENASSSEEKSQSRKKRQISPPPEVLKRRPEMDSSGFYGDTFTGGFGDFYTMKRNQKRKPEMDSSGFYGDTFSGGFGDFYTMKKRPQNPSSHLEYMKAVGGRPRRNIDDDNGDTEDERSRMKRQIHPNILPNVELPYYFYNQDQGSKRIMQKRHLGIDSRGFDSDIFTDGFGDFSTMKKR